MSCGKTHQGHNEVIVCSNADELATKSADLLVKLIGEAANERHTVSVALSGGTTPGLLYEQLIKDEFKSRIPWDKVRLFVSDERCVPMASKESNFGNAVRGFIAKVPIEGDHLHPTRDQDRDPEKAALEYDRLIRTTIPLGDHGLPQFDIIFLGMGPDGHTASLFPGTEALEDNERLVVANMVEKLGAERITFTYPLINSAANVIFLVKGQDKADVLAGVIEHKDAQYPASKVAPEHGSLYWILDADAACKLATCKT